MNAEPAIKQAERDYRRFDWNRDRQNLVDEVHRLTAAGVSAATIAEMIGISDRQVQRLRVTDLDEPTLYEFDTSDQRTRRLGRIADATLDLAVRLRDEDPTIVAESIKLMDSQTRLELTMIALAAIPVDQPKSEIFAWVEELP